MDESTVNTRNTLLNYIREHCKKNKITHEMLAERTGLKRCNVSRMLAGRFTPTLDNFIKVANAAGCKTLIETAKDIL